MGDSPPDDGEAEPPAQDDDRSGERDEAQQVRRWPQSSGSKGARALPRPTDAAAEGGRGLNNFDVLRPFAAALVVFTHTFQVVGKPQPVPGAVGMDYGQFGVLSFFPISGFLVARSRPYDPKVLSFAMPRALRLLAALIVSLLLAALVLGPLLSTVSFSDYVQDVKTKYYVLFHLLMQKDLQLPGVFWDIPYKGIVNAPLWTLQVEVKDIYAFPVQQAVVQLFDVTSPWLGLVYSVPVTAVLAVLSWHFIEAPGLTLKSGLAGYLDREADSARAHPAGRAQLAPAGAPA